MNFEPLKPKPALTEEEVNRGLKLVIGDGLAAEVMTTFTGGAFLVAMALLMGASNFQIGLLAALPMSTQMFQLFSIWLVRRFNNRRAVTVFSSLLARLPLLVIGVFALLYPSSV
ncbi:MAG TPA: MFS transporter, partial [Ohtaekwangia sp.]|nr:MFS transporter [Ohtaekwangia sp.]